MTFACVVKKYAKRHAVSGLEFVEYWVPRGGVLPERWRDSYDVEGS